MSSKRVICIGGGLASMYLANCLNQQHEILIIHAGNLMQTNSYMAKGGIAIPVNERDIDSHIADTLATGEGLCKKEVVKEVIGKAPQLLFQLKKSGIVFDPGTGLEGGHSRSRIRHIADETGKHLMLGIHKKVSRQNNIHYLTHLHSLQLWMHNDRCCGVLVFNHHKQQTELITADAVVMATGGCGSLFANHTNSALAFGEGYGMAYRIGAKVEGMEFMQFHPTKWFEPNAGEPFLITEALRGAGAFIVDHKRQEVMKGVHPLGSLAPRDIVSRTMYTTMAKEGLSNLWLAISTINPDTMAQQFPTIHKLCMQYGYYKNNLIPVTPAAHYMCGGIETNLNGETNIDGLYAIGEVASTGLHGANRLASNSLLELFIVGEQASKAIESSHTMVAKQWETVDNGVTRSEHLEQQFTTTIQQVMWESFGLVREKTNMKKGLEYLTTLTQENTQYLNEPSGTILQNRLTTARLIANSAIQRKQSIGCHFCMDKQVQEKEEEEAVLVSY